MNKTRISIAKPDIVRYFDQLPEKIFRQKDTFIPTIRSSDSTWSEPVTSLLNWICCAGSRLNSTSISRTA